MISKFLVDQLSIKIVFRSKALFDLNPTFKQANCHEFYFPFLSELYYTIHIYFIFKAYIEACCFTFLLYKRKSCATTSWSSNHKVNLTSWLLKYAFDLRLNLLKRYTNWHFYYVHKNSIVTNPRRQRQTVLIRKGENYRVVNVLWLSNKVQNSVLFHCSLSVLILAI